MDWLEERWENLKGRIRRMSLKRAMIAYVGIAVGIALLAMFISEMLLGNWYDIIWDRNARMGLERVHTISYEDEKLLQWIQFLRTGFPFCCLGILVMGAVVLFYRKRLKRPFGILMQAADAIGEGNLDVEIAYDSADEMGKLCGMFEEVRCEIVRDKEKMWRMVEEQREINAAFAHDLRTPLTVLRGYSDFLYRYIPEGKVSEEKLTGTLRLMSEHIQRLEAYSKTMRNIRNFEEIELRKEKIDILRLQARIQETADALSRIGEVNISLTEKCSVSRLVDVDENVILEVLENLISNAIRYARQCVEVGIQLDEKESELLMFVKDDGPGFSEEELEKAALPYFRGAKEGKEKKEKDKEHFGIGLHIALTLSQKHGGTLSLANSVEGGALVSVSFSYRKS